MSVSTRWADTTASIPASFEYEPQYVDIDGARMHYIEAGSGAPVVFLHGNPTWSYIWRNVIPFVAPHARCIAPDLMGMGYSDPSSGGGYRFFDHYDAIAAFIDRLGLDEVTFVGHDWGCSIAFHYLANHPRRVRGIAFLEGMVGSLAWRDMPARFRLAFGVMRTPVLGWLTVSVANAFVEVILPAATVRRLDAETMRRYREPFPTVASRRPVRQWPLEIPLDGRPPDVARAFKTYARVLQTSTIPKLLLHGDPGGVLQEPQVAWCRANLPNLETVPVGRGIHYLQEDCPEAIGRAIAAWYQGTAGGG
ncbi:haloalkane dehalogenase [Aquisalimonas lutea]|uniref:haloalkane dehalogenase n=1 Tax=Aquisalimonas lutea TaxID=1327750 RepID=UPI0025B48E77|nr:haloalkane dehalogenase [Aquisalimonas lutea]MDN3517149.1 haloalkane dehalogenase [Aquisalimonas lutea]